MNTYVKNSVIILFAFFLQYSCSAQSSPEQFTMEVTGECITHIQSDRGSIQLGFEKKHTQSAKAMDLVNESYRKILEKIKQLKLADEELHTTQIRLSEDTQWNNNKREVLGYIAEIDLNITTSQIQRLSEVISIARDPAVKRVSQLNIFASHELINQEKVKCLPAAIANAKEKVAVSITSLQAKKNYKIIKVSEVDYGYAGTGYNKAGYHAGQNSGAEIMMKTTAEHLPIEQGPQKLQVYVRALFSIQP